MIAAGPDKYIHDPKVALLARAATDGNVALIDQLVAEGVSPNARGDQGVTPLLWAIGGGNVDGIKALLQAGGDPMQGDDSGANSLALAARLDSPKVLQTIIETSHVDVNAIVDGDMTMLMSASKYGLIDTVKLLLRAGADPNVANPFGSTALDEAKFEFGVALTLLEAGANPSLPEGRGPNGPGWTFAQWVAHEAERVDTMPADYRAAFERVAAWLYAHHEAVSPPPDR